MNQVSLLQEDYRRLLIQDRNYTAHVFLHADFILRGEVGIDYPISNLNRKCPQSRSTDGSTGPIHFTGRAISNPQRFIDKSAPILHDNTDCSIGVVIPEMVRKAIHVAVVIATVGGSEQHSDSSGRSTTFQEKTHIRLENIYCKNIRLNFKIIIIGHLVIIYNIIILLYMTYTLRFVK
jgi:hypothetical protein